MQRRRFGGFLDIHQAVPEILSFADGYQNGKPQPAKRATPGAPLGLTSARGFVLIKCVLLQVAWSAPFWPVLRISDLGSHDFGVGAKTFSIEDGVFCSMHPAGQPM